MPLKTFIMGGAAAVVLSFAATPAALAQQTNPPAATPPEATAPAQAQPDQNAQPGATSTQQPSTSKTTKHAHHAKHHMARSGSSGANQREEAETQRLNQQQLANAGNQPATYGGQQDMKATPPSSNGNTAAPPAGTQPSDQMNQAKPDNGTAAPEAKPKSNGLEPSPTPGYGSEPNTITAPAGAPPANPQNPPPNNPNNMSSPNSMSGPHS